MNISPDNNTEYETKAVAFIDILGFKEIIKGLSQNPIKFFEIKRLLESLLMDEKRIYGVQARILLDYNKSFNMTVFSDSIVISDKFDQSDSLGKFNHSYNVLLHAKDIASRLLRVGVLCRGGVANGKMYHQDRIFFGDGLVRAFEFESQLAIYPRIIVSEDIANDLIARDDSLGIVNIKLSDILSRDVDGLWFINYFSKPLYGVCGTPGDDNSMSVSKADFWNDIRTVIS